MNMELGEVREIKLEDLKPLYVYEPQPFLDEMVAQLAASIERVGLMHPIIVRPTSDEKYEIICGHKRFFAVKALGYDAILADVKTGLSDDDALELMCQDESIPIIQLPCADVDTRYSIKRSNDKFFDLVDNQFNFVSSPFGPVVNYRGLFITDYSHLDREIIVGPNDCLELGGPLKPQRATSIATLKTEIGSLINESIQIVYGRRNTSEILCDSEKNLLVDQIVFDILFDKYLKESELMTRNGYSTYMSEKLYTDPIQRMECARAINENLRRGMESYYNLMKHSQLREQVQMLGVVPDKYAEYYNPRMKENPTNKKPKFIWDGLYYNFGRNPQEPVSDEDAYPKSKHGQGMITAKQYRRQFTRKGRNYSYEEIIESLNSYHSFVSKLLPAEYESYEKYFRMSMDYYVLESYKRIDFMFKLTVLIPKIGIDEIDRDNFLIKRYHPEVLVPCRKESQLCFAEKHKYYRPLFMIEDNLHKVISNDDNPDYGAYERKLQTYQLIRAKTYELFKYHYEFCSDDYVEIKDFLCQYYNMRSYHQSNPVWKLIQNIEWKSTNKETKQQIMELLQNIISINNEFFWPSPDREYTKPQSE